MKIPMHFKLTVLFIGMTLVVYSYINPVNNMKNFGFIDWSIIIMGIFIVNRLIYFATKKKKNKVRTPLPPLNKIEPIVPIPAKAPENVPMIQPAEKIEEEIPTVQPVEHIPDTTELKNSYNEVDEILGREEMMKKEQQEEKEMANEFNYFEDVLEDESNNDISTIGNKLANDFDKSVTKMMEQLDKEADKLEKEKEHAENINSNIQSTVKKLWFVNQRLNNTIERLDKMIKTNKIIKKQLNGVKEISDN